MRASWMGTVMLLGACGGGLPDLEPYDVGGAVVWAPVGWTVSVDETGQVISMEEDPSDDETASVLILAGYAGGASAEDVEGVFVDVLESDGGFRDLEAEQTQSTSASVATERTGFYGDTPATVGALTLVDPGLDVFLLTAFAARTRDYARHGGMDLVVAVLAGPPAEPADAPAGDATWTAAAGDAMGADFSQMWDEMYGTWSNNIGDNGWCWGDDAGCR